MNTDLSLGVIAYGGNLDTTMISNTWTGRHSAVQTVVEGFDVLSNVEASPSDAWTVSKKGRLKSKRKCKRFRPEPGAFALVRSNLPTSKRIHGASLGEIALSVFKAAPSKMGQIVDMNLFGLSFHYIDDRNQPAGLEELDILLAVSGFYLDRIPFNIVADTTVPTKDPCQTIKMRRLGVQFKEISVYQKDRLHYFLRNYTSGTA